MTHKPPAAPAAPIPAEQWAHLERLYQASAQSEGPPGGGGSDADLEFLGEIMEHWPALLAEVERLRAELDACRLAVAIQDVVRDSESYRADVLNNKMVDEHERADTAETALATMMAAHQERCEKVRELQEENDKLWAKVQKL